MNRFFDENTANITGVSGMDLRQRVTAHRGPWHRDQLSGSVAIP